MSSDPSCKTFMSSTMQDRRSVLWPRNIRMDHRQYGRHVLTRLEGHRKAAEERIEKFGARKQLEDDGMWLCEESPKTKSKIEHALERLLNTTPTVEAEWSARFWQKFFFKPGKHSRTILDRWLERRQLHSESYADVGGSTEQIDKIDIQDRYPPIVSHISRPSVQCALEPWVLSKFNRRGYAYSDVFYANNVRECEPKDFLDAIRRYPTIRLFRNSDHLAGALFAEIKPCGTLKYQEESKDHALRYSTLTAAIMLHEKLKLCHMASDDPAFFPESDDLGIHFITTVGCTAYHYFHCIRDQMNDFVKYESYAMESFDLRDASDRNRFRQQLNLIHVYHSTTVREIELERLRKVYRLGKQEVESRLLSRAHQHVCFKYVKRGDLFGFRASDKRKAVEGIAPTLETRNPVNPISDTSVEEQLNEAATILPSRAVDTGKPFMEDLEGTPKDSEHLSLGRPAHDQDAVTDGGVIIKDRYGKKKRICGSTNTKTGKPCMCLMHYSSEGFFRCQHYPKHKSAIGPTAS